MGASVTRRTKSEPVKIERQQQNISNRAPFRSLCHPAEPPGARSRNSRRYLGRKPQLGAMQLLFLRKLIRRLSVLFPAATRRVSNRLLLAPIAPDQVGNTVQGRWVDPLQQDGGRPQGERVE